MRNRGEGQRNITQFLGVISRRRWTVIVPILALVAVAVVHFVLATPRYEAKSEVLLSRQNLANTLNGAGAQSFQPNEFFQIATTQANLATSTQVAERVLEATGE